ncbi:protein RER1A-like, partial [Phalaenopsis equestris]|uniref:protein RER1A-like n=1 Tax=Phalaenopsis equestris TaxID=78828 RepID=UPI0009E2AA87
MMDSSSASSAGVTGLTSDDSRSYSSGGIPFISSWTTAVSQRYQYYLDKATPFVLRRWLSFGVVALIYLIRVVVLEGFYIVSYGLGIYVLNLFIAFLSPQVDPEMQQLLDGDGPSLPTRASDEFRPFVRRLPEFKFWCE